MILECKPAVAFVLTGGDTTMNDVSQLFLEAIYMHKKENAKLIPTKQYHFTICIQESFSREPSIADFRF